MKIALYQHLNSERDPIILEVSKYFEDDSSLLRVSEIMDIEFKELDKSPKSMVAALKVAAAQKAFDEAQAKLKALQDAQ